MDPIQKAWMYENWLADQKDTAELAKNHAYLLASFWNPEEVSKILGDGNTIISTDDEFEESSKLVKEMNMKSFQSKNVKPTHKRRRPIVKG